MKEFAWISTKALDCSQLVRIHQENYIPSLTVDVLPMWYKNQISFNGCVSSSFFSHVRVSQGFILGPFSLRRWSSLSTCSCLPQSNFQNGPTFLRPSYQFTDIYSPVIVHNSTINDILEYSPYRNCNWMSSKGVYLVLKHTLVILIVWFSLIALFLSETRSYFH